MLAQTSVALRLTVVDTIGTPSDGGSLAGQNVNAFPEGVLFYVRDKNRFYRLKKGLDVVVIPDVTANKNVVAGVGSSAAAGYFVACQQQGTVTLVGGTAAVSGLDLSTSGNFLLSLVTQSGTTGYVHGATTTVAQATFTSTQADTGTYVFVFVETGTEA